MAVLAAPGVASAAFDVTPTIDCLDAAGTSADGDPMVTAWFGYDNPNAAEVDVPLGSDNITLQPPNFRNGQTTAFEPGVHRRAWSTTFVPANQPFVQWVLQGAEVAADPADPSVPSCAATGNVVWAGPWAAGTRYTPDELVTFGGASWLGSAISMGDSPAIDSPSWVQLAARGPRGSDGPEGRRRRGGPCRPCRSQGRRRSRGRPDDLPRRAHLPARPARYRDHQGPAHHGQEHDRGAVRGQRPGDAQAHAGRLDPQGRVHRRGHAARARAVRRLRLASVIQRAIPQEVGSDRTRQLTGPLCYQEARRVPSVDMPSTGPTRSARDAEIERD
jgi:hypothetical protein